MTVKNILLEILMCGFLVRFNQFNTKELHDWLKLFIKVIWYLRFVRNCRGTKESTQEILFVEVILSGNVIL